MKKTSNLLKNTILFAIGSFGSRIISFLLVPLYTNYLSASEYGTADLVVTTYTLLLFIFSLSIFDAIFPFVIDNNLNRENILSYALKIIMIGSSILAGIIVIIPLFYKEFVLYYGIYVLIGFILNAYNRLISNYLQAINKVKEVVIGGILQTILMLLLNILFVTVFSWGMHGYLIALLFGCGISFIYQVCIIIKRDYYHISKHRLDIDTRKAIIIFTIPLIFNNICWWINSSIDKYFIIWICGADHNGLYSVASKIPSIMTMCVSFFLQAWGISAIKEFDTKDEDGFFSNTYRIFNTLITILCSLMILFMPTIAKILFAKDFFGAWKFSEVLVISGVFSALGSFIGAVFSSVKESKLYAVSTVSAAIINIVFNFILIPRLGVLGASVATVISFIFVWIVRLKKSYKFIQWKLSIGKDCLCYAMLVMQAVLGWNSYYVMQLIPFILIMIIQKHNIKIIVCKIFKKYN